MNMEFITLKGRETIFLLTNLSNLSGLSFMCILFVFVIIRNESCPCSMYQLVLDTNYSHWSVDLLAKLGIIFMETILLADLTLHIMLYTVLSYVAYFSISFWLRKTWLVIN